MSAAQTEARSRSRSPRLQPADGDAAGTGEVPSHFSKPASGEGKASGTAPAKKGKGGKKGFRPGANSEILSEQRTEEELTPTVLLTMASKVEGEDKEVTPAQVGKLLRQAAARLGALEKNIEDIGQTIRAVNQLTGRALASSGLLAGDLNMPTQMVMADEDSEGKPATQSYMIKKADSELAELHEKAREARPSTVGSTNAGGALSGEAKTREEMDRARQERLQRLEKQQADKQKQMEQAAEKNRAREALFEKPFLAPAKTLGKM